MPCCVLQARLQSWLGDYDVLQKSAVLLIYIQIGCALIGSLGALYNGVLLINLSISLFALVAIESINQSLGRTFAVLLFCSLLLDVFWFILFIQEIWNISSAGYGTFFFVFSVKLALAMQIIGFFVRVLSSFIWIQIYRLGVSRLRTSVPPPLEDDFDFRNSFLSPSSIHALPRQRSQSDAILEQPFFTPAYYSSVSEDGREAPYLLQDEGVNNCEDGSPASEYACQSDVCTGGSLLFADEKNTIGGG